MQLYQASSVTSGTTGESGDRVVTTGQKGVRERSTYIDARCCTLRLSLFCELGCSDDAQVAAASYFACVSAESAGTEGADAAFQLDSPYASPQPLLQAPAVTLSSTQMRTARGGVAIMAVSGTRPPSLPS